MLCYSLHGVLWSGANISASARKHLRAATMPSTYRHSWRRTLLFERNIHKAP